MTKKLPWYDKKIVESKFIETPLTTYVGGTDTVIWPWFFVFLSIGGFICLMSL